MCRSEVFKRYTYNQKNVPAEDYEIFAKMVKDELVLCNLPEILTYVRVHSDSVSNNIAYSTIKRTYKIRDEIFELHSSKYKIFFYYVHPWLTV